jgi:hypothetical protein
MPERFQKTGKRRPPRIRVPNNEKALFTINLHKFVGVIRRLSLTGGSVAFSRRSIPEGALAEMELKTVFGKVTAQIEFLQTGADGVPHVQAFRFLEMDDLSWERFKAATAQMQRAGFSDVEDKANPLADLVSQSWSVLRKTARHLPTLF